MLEVLKTEYDGKKRAEFPSTPDERAVWAWLGSLEEHALVDALHKLYTTQTASQFKEREVQMDIFFRKSAAIPSGTFKYKQVLVGEQKKSYDTSRFKADLLQLTRYVRGVFSDQPTRRFVHGFTLRASMMRLWVFDRSGAYSSGPFDIHEKPTLARTLVGYATMNSDAMGLDTFIEREAGHRYVTLDNTNGKESRTELVKPIVRQKAVVCRWTSALRPESITLPSFMGIGQAEVRSGTIEAGRGETFRVWRELWRIAESPRLRSCGRAWSLGIATVSEMKMSSLTIRRQLQQARPCQATSASHHLITFLTMSPDPRGYDPVVRSRYKSR